MIGGRSLCPICKSANSRVLFKKARIKSLYNPPVLYDKLNTVMCFSCSHVFRNPMPKSIIDSTYYDEDYQTVWRKKDTAHVNDEYIHKLFKQNLKNTKYFKFLIDNEYFNTNDQIQKNLVDIGCGVGVFSYLMAKNFRNINVYAIEPGLDFLNYIKLPNLFFYKISFEEFFKINRTKFDYVVLTGVIEHIAHPYSLLTKIFNCMEWGAHLYIYTHNEYPSPFVSFKPRISFPHVQYFDKRTMERLLVRSGLTLMKCTIISQTGMYAISKKQSGPLRMAISNSSHLSITKKYILFWCQYKLDFLFRIFERFYRTSRIMYGKLAHSKKIKRITRPNSK